LIRLFEQSSGLEGGFILKPGAAGSSSSVTGPLAKVTIEKDRDESGLTKISDISHLLELG